MFFFALILTLVSLIGISCNSSTVGEEPPDETPEPFINITEKKYDYDDPKRGWLTWLFEPDTTVDPWIEFDQRPDQPYRQTSERNLQKTTDGQDEWMVKNTDESNDSYYFYFILLIILLIFVAIIGTLIAIDLNKLKKNQNKVKNKLISVKQKQMDELFGPTERSKIDANNSIISEIDSESNTLHSDYDTKQKDNPLGETKSDPKEESKGLEGLNVLDAESVRSEVV